MKKNFFRRYQAGLFFLLSVIFYSEKTFAFICDDAAGNALDSRTGGGNASVYVNLTPQLQPGQNLVVDITNSIGCRNTAVARRDDYVSLLSGSTYSGVLSTFSGSLNYYGVSHPFPLTKPTAEQLFVNSANEGWKVKLLLTPISVASGILINPGDLVATLVMFQRGADKGTVNDNEATATFTWNIYALNSVVMPTGGCTITAKNVTVTLPDYPGTANVPVSIHCEKDEKLKFFLNGTTVDTGKTIFVNQASVSPAQGVGVQLKRNNSVIPTNTDVLIGTVGTSTVDLGLTATYARTSGQVTAGNVQSIIDLTFEYQ